MRSRHAGATGALLALLLLAGCSDDDGGGSTAPDSSAPSDTSIPTLSPLPYPEDPPPTGKLIADMRQSSIDLSLGQMQVWVDNDTRHDVTPTRILYHDPRLAKPLLGGNLRTNPAQSERGYPFDLPLQPLCPDTPGKPESGTLEVRYGGQVDSIPVTDPTDVLGRYLTGRCEEIAVAKVADLQWSNEVPDDGTGEGAVGTLTMLIRPTGVPGHTLVIDRIAGSHLLSYVAGDEKTWEPGVEVRSDGPPTQIELQMKPTRCDGHAFSEGGGATAWRVALTLDGEPGEIVLRMSPEGMGNALHYALGSCGLG
jgi:hypothetical protein